MRPVCGNDHGRRFGWVFGVPTFSAGDDAVFVRLMQRPHGDPDASRATIERLLDLLTDWSELNEFKHTRIPR